MLMGREIPYLFASGYSDFDAEIVRTTTSILAEQRKISQNLIATLDYS
jgi:hypothetical protein